MDMWRRCFVEEPKPVLQYGLEKREWLAMGRVAVQAHVGGWEASLGGVEPREVCSSESWLGDIELIGVVAGGSGSGIEG
ncbi:uncharacterized protein EMH_0083480 [Eimeria mitis]|uniref:Uncharacterized protein n=1 Tax=Eimeria mitis TaxID=44415 RepID=U6KEQ1_9EIME|nr:uncharacterized protein EMH_0083480 [Eimeria mitis]CDJ36404.1 hypothetical protein EMH_0083480 [Eimeria mitis]